VPLHDSRPATDREPAGGLLGDRSRECSAGQVERAADRQRLVLVALEPFLDVEIEAGQPVVFVCHRVVIGQYFTFERVPTSPSRVTQRGSGHGGT
jgi:hypothetical protein